MTDLESRTLCIDIDQTLCISSAQDYAEAEPISGAREAINQLRQDGWLIVLHTGRHFNHWQVTIDWLTKYGFKYDQIVFGKPPARFYIDDRDLQSKAAFNALYDLWQLSIETPRLQRQPVTTIQVN